MFIYTLQDIVTVLVLGSLLVAALSIWAIDYVINTWRKIKRYIKNKKNNKNEK